MADSFILSLAAELNLASLGNINISPPKPTGVPIYSEQDIELASGDNTINFKQGTHFALIIFAAGSPVIKKLKGAGGDTGITVNPTGMVLLPLSSASPGSFIINCNLNDTTYVTRILIF